MEKEITGFLNKIGFRTEDYTFTSLENKRQIRNVKGNHIFYMSQPKSSITDGGGRSIYVVDYAAIHDSVILDNKNFQSNYLVILADNEDQQISVQSIGTVLHRVKAGKVSLRLPNQTKMEKIFVATKQGKLLQTFEQHPVDGLIYAKENIKFQ